MIRETWISGTEGPKLGHALDHLYDERSTTDAESEDSMRNVEANAMAYAQTRDQRARDKVQRAVEYVFDDELTPTHYLCADEDSTPEFVKDDERLGWGSREDS